MHHSYLLIYNTFYSQLQYVNSKKNSYLYKHSLEQFIRKLVDLISLRCTNCMFTCGKFVAEVFVNKNVFCKSCFCSMCIQIYGRFVQISLTNVLGMNLLFKGMDTFHIREKEGERDL